MLRHCVCGHPFAAHLFDFDLEEPKGCQACDDCPSIGRFFQAEPEPAEAPAR